MRTIFPDFKLYRVYITGKFHKTSKQKTIMSEIHHDNLMITALSLNTNDMNKTVQSRDTSRQFAEKLKCQSKSNTLKPYYRRISHDNLLNKWTAVGYKQHKIVYGRNIFVAILHDEGW